jgi:hypothetical protein
MKRAMFFKDIFINLAKTEEAQRTIYKTPPPENTRGGVL